MSLCSKTTLVEVARAAIAACDARDLTAARVHRRGDVLEVHSDAAKLRARLPPAPAEVVLLAVGKGAAGQAAALAETLGPRLARGLVIVPEGTRVGSRDARLRHLTASHPVPDARSLRAGRAAVRLVASTGPADLLVVVLSGGASALLEVPAVGLAPGDLVAATRALLASGIDIVGVNAVRKHLSATKGGRLASLTRARVLTLVLSDVLAGDVDAVGSGPTVPDPTTYAQALALARGASRRAELDAILDHLARGARGELAETPKPSPALARRWRSVVLASPATLLAAAARAAAEAGLDVVEARLGRPGERVEAVAREVASAAAGLLVRARASRRVQAAVWVREPVVRLGRHGRGGRGSHLALLVARELSGRPGVAFASVGSDGADGNTTAAGAAVDGASWEARTSVDPARALARFDSGLWAESVGAAVRTGRTGTNLLDLELLAVAPPG